MNSLARNLVVVLLLIGAGAAFAQLTLLEVISPSLGVVIGGPAGRQLTLNTDGSVTGANAADHLSGAIGGLLTIRKQGGPVLLNIVAENITTTGGLAVNSVPCRWRSEPQTTCDGTGINRRAAGFRRLGVGIDITTTQVHGGGDTASVTYDITVTIL